MLGAYTEVACSFIAHLRPSSPWACCGWKLVAPGQRASGTSELPQFTFPSFPRYPVINEPKKGGWTAGWAVCHLPRPWFKPRPVNFLLGLLTTTLWRCCEIYITDLCFCRCSQLLISDHRKNTSWMSKRVSQRVVAELQEHNSCESKVLNSLPANSNK